jgi:hypothetical protein
MNLRSHTTDANEQRRLIPEMIQNVSQQRILAAKKGGPLIGAGASIVLFTTDLECQRVARSLQSSNF